MSYAEGGSAKFFCHPLGDFRRPMKITLPPPVRNPENPPVYDHTFISIFMQAYTRPLLVS